MHYTAIRHSRSISYRACSSCTFHSAVQVLEPFLTCWLHPRGKRFVPQPLPYARSGKPPQIPPTSSTVPRPYPIPSPKKVAAEINKTDKIVNHSSGGGKVKPVSFSLGDLRLPDNLSVQDDVETPGGIAITWANNAGVGNAQATDRLRVLAMSEGEVSVLEGLNITRDAEAANILLPFGAGVEAQVYLFFENEANTSFSASVHTAVALS